MAVDLANDDSFQDYVSSHNKVVVKYFADWCGSCRLIAPKFRRLSDDDRFGDIKFLDVNAEQSPASRKIAGVTNLPFFAIFKDGDFTEGFSGNKEEAVVELIQKLDE